DSISKIHAKGCCCPVIAQYVVWHPISRLEQKIGASEHSSKQMHTTWLALPHEMTSIASNGPILYLKYMPTGVVALLWPGCGVAHHKQVRAEDWGLWAFG